MKFFTIFVTLVAFCKVESFSRDTKNNALQKAFVGIVQALSKKNHLVSIVVDSVSSCKTKPAVFKSIADFPHVVAKFDNG